MLVNLMLLLACPMAAAGLLLLFNDERSSRWIALLGSVTSLAFAAFLLVDYSNGGDAIRFSGGDALRVCPVDPIILIRFPWIDYSLGGKSLMAIELLLGLDGISVLMMFLTALLMVCAVLSSWTSITERSSQFYAALLVLESSLLFVFCAFDLALFFVCFEFTLLPLFFIVGVWGGAQRKYAATKFFLYTLVGGLVTLVGLVGLIQVASSLPGDVLGSHVLSIPDLARCLALYPLSIDVQIGLFIAVSIGFMVKVPLFPFHTWLPLAHVEAPTAGSILLAGVLLKLGVYGFLRICLPLFPAACIEVGIPLVGWLSVVGIVYGSLCALVQRDIKKIVAYSSVAHLGFCMLGLFSLNVEGITGSVLQMINHGLSTGALFLIVGMIYERYHTRLLDDLGGLAQRLPLISASMVLICMASIGLPMLNGFVGEVLCLMGMFRTSWLFAAIGATGVVLGAWYTLSMLQSAFFGPLKEPRSCEHGISDMNSREFLAVAPLMALCVYIGVYPGPMVSLISPDVKAIVKLFEQSIPQSIPGQLAESGSVVEVKGMRAK